MTDIVKMVGLPDMTGDKGARGEDYLPVVDGVVLPDDPARLFSSGKFAHVALIAGTNADEGTLFGGPPVHSLAQFRTFASKTFGAQTDGFLAVYPAATDADAYAAATLAQGDYEFLAGTRSVLRTVSKGQNKAFQYQFTRVNGVGRRLESGLFPCFRGLLCLRHASRFGLRNFRHDARRFFRGCRHL